MGEVLNDSVRFLRSVQMVSDPSQRIYLDDAYAWQNVVEPSDITNDGVLSVLDALVAINELSVGSVTNLLTGQLNNPLDLADWPGYYYDQNGDERLSTLDALRVLNELALIQGDEGEGEEVLMPNLLPISKTSNEFQGTAAPVSSGTGGLASEQITKFELTTFHTPAFESASTVFEPCLVRSESTNVTDLDRQQAVDTVMVKLLHETNWLP
jgi:hypothetical protein